MLRVGVAAGLGAGAIFVIVAFACSGYEPRGGDDDDDSAGEANGGSTGGGEAGDGGSRSGGTTGAGGSAVNGGTTGEGGTTSTGGTPAQGGTRPNGGAGAGGSSGTAAAGTSGAGAGGSSGAGGASGAGGSGGSGGSPPRVYKTCLKGCTSAADCGSGTPGDSAPNYRCVDGGCKPAGCVSDTECDARIAGDVCRPQPDYPYDVCSRPCTGPEVCGYPEEQSPAWSSDNYACSAGICVYIGCHTTEECLASFVGVPTIVCAPREPYPFCNYSCQVPSDCVFTPSSPLFDASHYECNGGVCEHLGCFVDGDCAPNVGYVCRSIP